eukprot:7376739-Prymnesium_polylepis.1
MLLGVSRLVRHLRHRAAHRAWREAPADDKRARADRDREDEVPGGTHAPRARAHVRRTRGERDEGPWARSACTYTAHAYTAHTHAHRTRVHETRGERVCDASHGQGLGLACVEVECAARARGAHQCR